MAAGLGGSWSDGRKQCRRSRPGASGTALVRTEGRGACGAGCAACTSRGCRTLELVNTAKAGFLKLPVRMGAAEVPGPVGRRPSPRGRTGPPPPRAEPQIRPRDPRDPLSRGRSRRRGTRLREEKARRGRLPLAPLRRGKGRSCPEPAGATHRTAAPRARVLLQRLPPPPSV